MLPSPARLRIALLLVTATAIPGLTGCGSSPGGGTSGSQTLTVYAAASLTGTFTELAADFEAARPGVRVALNFGGSADLAAQIQQGAPADVFASADAATMARVTADGLHAQDPRTFASNTLTIITPRDNPAGVRSFTDLTRDDVALVVCAPAVPCGAATAQLAEIAGPSLTPVSEEQNVKDVLAKVTAGEADAGLVYVTDAIAAGDAVRTVAVPQAGAAANTYPIVALRDSEHADLATAFVALVLSDAGRSVLAAAGFAT